MGGGSSTGGRKQKHFFFGEVIRKKDYGKHMIVVTNPILNKEEYQEWEERYKKSHDMNKETLLIPENFQYKKLQRSVGACNCCGAEGATEMTYEDTSFSLHQEINNRRSKKNYYSQEEAIFFLYSMLQGGKEFQIRSMHLGDIRTKNILITKSGSLKMVNVCSFPDERTAVDKILDKFDNSTVFFLAPEEIDFVKSYGKDKDIPNARTEAWAIGLSALEVATLQNSEEIYEIPGRKIKENILTERLNEVKSKYKNLYNFLESVLRMNQSQRMTSGECWASMRPYSEAITELKGFKRSPSDQNEAIRKFLAGGSGRR